MFYFGNQDVSTAQLNEATLLELMQVKKFQSEMGSLGGVYHEYENIQGFRESLRSHLVRKVNTYGISWGPEGDNTSAASPSNIAEPVEEATLIDLAADAEEAMETYSASISRITSGISLLGENMQKRAAEANMMKIQRGVSAKRVRGFLRGVADDITASRTLVGNEVVVYTSSWSIFKDSVLKIISQSSVISDADRAAAGRLVDSLQNLYGSMESALAPTQTLLESMAAISGSKDLNRSSRELADTLATFINETMRMMAEVRDIQSGLRGMLS